VTLHTWYSLIHTKITAGITVAKDNRVLACLGGDVDTIDKKGAN